MRVSGGTRAGVGGRFPHGPATPGHGQGEAGREGESPRLCGGGVGGSRFGS